MGGFHHHGPLSESDKLVEWAARAAVLTALALLAMKLYAWFVTGSMGILASLVDSCLDLGASLVNMLAVRYARVPPDDEHRFGHGKAEALAGLGQSMFIASSALFLMIYSIERIINPELIEQLELGAGVVVLSIVMTSGLVLFQRYVVRHTGSVAIKADSLHYSADLITNLAILLGLLLYHFAWLYADPLIALCIGAYILKCALQIASESVQLLLDRELPPEDHAKIEEVVARFDRVLEVHGLRSRQSGRTKFIQLHLVMDGHLSLAEAHRISDAVECALSEVFDDADIIIHQDPHTEAVDKSLSLG